MCMVRSCISAFEVDRVLVEYDDPKLRIPWMIWLADSYHAERPELRRVIFPHLTNRVLKLRLNGRFSYDDACNYA